MFDKEPSSEYDENKFLQQFYQDSEVIFSQWLTSPELEFWAQDTKNVAGKKAILSYLSEHIYEVYGRNYQEYIYFEQEERYNYPLAWFINYWGSQYDQIKEELKYDPGNTDLIKMVAIMEKINQQLDSVHLKLKNPLTLCLNLAQAPQLKINYNYGSVELARVQTELRNLEQELTQLDWTDKLTELKQLKKQLEEKLEDLTENNINSYRRYLQEMQMRLQNI